MLISSEYYKRLIRLISGCVIMGIGVSFALSSSHGGDALSFFWRAFSELTNTSIFTSSLLIALLMFIPPLIWSRSKIGIGTILQPIIVSLFSSIEFFKPELLIVQIILLIIGLLLIGVGTSIYLSSDLGAVTYDACVLIISSYTNKSIGLIRIICDFILFLLACIILGYPTIGPFFAVFIIGSVINTVTRLIEK